MTPLQEASMGEVSTVGIDLAKSVFQVHGSGPSGAVVFRKKLPRPQFARFMADHPTCEVAMEASADVPKQVGFQWNLRRSPGRTRVAMNKINVLRTREGWKLVA